MRKGILYLHGKNGSADEAEHYRALFPDCDVVGLDYRAETPWDAQTEFRDAFDRFRAAHTAVDIVAVSVGAFFAMQALNDREIERAFFVSPIVDMERLITDMMGWARVTERELREKGTIETAFGETLSWDYLTWVREHPVSWHVPSAILYGARDDLQSLDTIRVFAGRWGAEVTVMEEGGHWFHTPEQMAFLDCWIRERTASR